MKLVFSDEFEYTGKPDPKKWAYETGGHGWGNHEAQYYTDSLENSYVKDGKLYIVAKRQDVEDNKYSSAKLVTYGKFSYKYGRVDVCAKIPSGVGSWPAIWMLSDAIQEGIKDWPLCGEIDIMEHVGKNQDQIHFSLHSETYNHTKDTQPTYFEKFPRVSEGFHVYSCDWNEEYIAFLFDDREVARFYKEGPGRDTTEAGWPFDQNFYLILNVAVGGGWGGPVIDEAALPYVMEIDYVRVYQ